MDTLILPKERLSKIKLASGDTVSLALTQWPVPSDDEWGTNSKRTQPKPQVAIISFVGDKSSTPEQLDAITERFQTEVSATNQFVILNRNQIDLILKEQGFQQSGTCSSSECQVKVGQLLGVDKLITGKFVTFGGIYSINIGYMNVETGVIEHSISFEVQGTLVNVLTSGCKEGADRLVAKVFPGLGYTPTTLAPVAKQADPIRALPTPPQKKPHSSKSKWVAIAFDALAAGALGFGLYQNNQASSTLNTYRGLGESLASQEYDRAWTKVTDARTLRNIGYFAAAGLLATGLTIHFAF